MVNRSCPVAVIPAGGIPGPQVVDSMGESVTDKARFDAIARSLGDRRSRRGALALLAGATGLVASGTEAKRIRPPRTLAACVGAGTKVCPASQAQVGANISGCNYRLADLRGRTLTGVNASKTNFSGADLRGVNFRGANLTLACFSGARVSGSGLKGSTSPTPT